jgi:regulator of protease activity HflC (stomatin/prohibitin superfamily)
MFGFKKIIVSDNERVLQFKNNRLDKLLMPGEYWLPMGWQKIRLEGYDIIQPEFAHSLGKFLLTTYRDIIGEQVESVQTNENQVGLVYFDNVLSDLVEPNQFKMYWQEAVEVRIEFVDIEEDFEVSSKLLSTLIYNSKPDVQRKALTMLYHTEVKDKFVGLLKVNGKLVRILEPGLYGFWRFQRQIEVGTLDCRLQTMEVSGQEILTKDRVSLRVNLSANYRIVDTQKVAVELKSHVDFLYREFQLALREVVGTRSLDAILEDKDTVNAIVTKRIKSNVELFGLEVLDVGVKDIILPGDMKTILNQVVEAEKSAEANLIKRREETQATRSLHNTAKVMDGNPTLMRLKELEVLERLSGKINQLTVYGGLDGVMNDMVKLTK